MKNAPLTTRKHPIQSKNTKTMDLGAEQNMNTNTQKIMVKT